MNDLDRVLDFVKSEQKRAKKGLKMWGWIGSSTKSFHRGAITFLENVEDFIEIEKITKRKINTKINLGTILDIENYEYTIENFNVDIKLCEVQITVRSLNLEKQNFTIDLSAAKKLGVIDITFLNKVLK